MTMYVNPSEEANEEPQFRSPGETERRRAARLKQKFVTQATPWAPGIPSVPFEVIIEDLSEVGVGLIHDQPMGIGIPYLLTVPRGDEGRSLIREYIVVRCSRKGDGKYAVGMELSTARERGDVQAKKRVCSSRLKLLFLLFGIFGLLIATFAPL